MAEDREVVVYVESKLTPVGTVETLVPLKYGVLGLMLTYPTYEERISIKYARTLNDAERRLIEDARRAALQAGYKFTVIDLGMKHPLVRFMKTRLFGAKRPPFIFWKGSFLSYHRQTASSAAGCIC